MKTVLQVFGAGLFGFVLVFVLMKVSEQPEITFTTLPSGEEVVWSAKHSDGTEMSVQEAEKHVAKGGHYVRQTHIIPPLGSDRFGMNLDPFSNLSKTERVLRSK